VFARIEREQGESGRQAAIDLLNGFQVIAIRANRATPGCLQASESDVIHHVLGLATEPIHFAERLQRENRRYPLPVSAKGARVPRGGQTEPVADAGGGVESDELWSKGGNTQAHGHRVPRRERRRRRRPRRRFRRSSSADDSWSR